VLRGIMQTFAEPTTEQVRRFLIESERRVVLHCRKLLGAKSLSFEHRRRLTQVLGAAETELQRLDPRLRIDAAAKTADFV
jgi:hypothetical protein